MSTNISKYFYLISKLKQNPNKVFTAYDQEIQKALNLETKQIGRMFETLEQEFEDIVKHKIVKKKAYSYIHKINLLKSSLDYQGEISAIIQTIKDYDEDIVDILQNHTTSSYDIYQTIDQPLKSLKQLESLQIFKHLKKAIIKKHIVDIKLQDQTVLYDVCILKFIYTDSNWFVAVLDTQENIKLYPASQIIELGKHNKNQTISLTKIKKYINKLKNIQNSKTNLNERTKTARLKALPNIAMFFGKNSKKFFQTQKFVRKQSDGSIVLTIDYTQEEEVLQFIQKWIPNLLIQSPLQLRQTQDKHINKYIANQTYESG
ncbi:MAG: hypothetical protein DRG11_06910 [Epsilonproteobacteria bacterium]|nr:MAG: hypothetical protein DRG11_06910 [Campylobacterota bacterium]